MMSWFQKRLIRTQPAFKTWWTRIVPKVAERSTYVLWSSLALVLIYSQWRALPRPVVWATRGPFASFLLVVNGFGWLRVLISTFLINHFDLFGLRQVWAYASGKENLASGIQDTWFLRSPPRVTCSSASSLRSMISWPYLARPVSATADRFQCACRGFLARRPKIDLS